MSSLSDTLSSSPDPEGARLAADRNRVRVNKIWDAFWLLQPLAVQDFDFDSGQD
jgi:hypothetical protein